MGLNFMPVYWALMASLVLFGCVVPSMQASCYSTLRKEEFSDCKQLAPNYALHWKVNSNDTVTFGIEIDQTSGWFALGLSEGGGMKGADIWTFSKDASGNWVARDLFSVDYVTPTEDTSQDIAISSVQQSGQTTTLVFNRKLDTCDYEKDQVMYPQYGQPYIYAFGSEWKYHGLQNRGTSFLVLAANETSATVNAVADKDEKNITLAMPNITVPPVETSYLCTNLNVPRDKKYQIIASDYIITPSKMVHHMILYACYRKPDKPVGEIYDCFSTPPECTSFTLGWAPGQWPEKMPANTGFPFGNGSFEHFMIQVHYTNPEQKVGVKDSSGFVVTYTDNLRKHDLGVMWLGSTTFQIPPNQEAFSLPPNVCPSECTSRFTSDLTLSATEFHMHQTGARQTVQRLRADKEGGQMQELIPPNYHDYYDFYWQGLTFILPGAETMLRGDAFITTCTFNTKGRTNITNSGPSSYDEMCFNFMRYYPAQKIDTCTTIEGSENNGTAFVQCANQKEFFEYLENKNVTDFNESVVTDLVKQGFLVQYNTTQYKTFTPYNRSANSNCAASLTPSAPAPPAGRPNSSNSSIASAASTALPAAWQLLFAFASYIMLSSALLPALA